jgi:hypothetical protein
MECMLITAAIAGGICFVAAWFLAAKLLALKRPVGGEPARFVATACAGILCVGCPLAALSRAPGMVGTNEGSLIFTIAMIGFVTGQAAISRIPLAVFRPGKAWAEALSLTTIAIAVAAGIGSVVVIASATTRVEMVERVQPWALALLGAIGVPMLWHAIESSLYYRVMKSRLAIGLSDATRTHQILLWTVAGWALSILIVALLAIRASGLAILAPLPMTLFALSALVGTTAWGLSLFMPDFYRARLERRQEKQSQRRP